uniref:Rhs-related protein n=1 Tax=Ralstonia solanacearum TaxID=305 RepID=A0A0S4X0V5_RALSL
MPTASTNSYDAAGNQTGDGTTTYSYSDRGRLASVSKNGTTTSYLYNGLGQRVLKSGSNVPTGATRYVYDGAGHLIGEYDQSGNAIQETVYLGDTPIATVKNGTPYYIYADQIDTPRVITDTNNLMVWRWDQADPFGATLPDENPTSLGTFTYNLRFPGQVYDAETGKHYNANRDYDPAGGRYIQSDPIGINGGQPSTYAYVGGQPTRYTDPKGLCIGPLAIVCVVLAEKGVEIAVAAEIGAAIATGTATATSVIGSELSTIGRTVAQEMGAVQAYNNYRQAKNVIGSKPGMELHHIVEQCQASASRSGFPVSRINSTDNLMWLPENVHSKISSYYASRPPIGTASRFRDTLDGTSWESQYKTGLDVIMRALSGNL